MDVSAFATSRGPACPVPQRPLKLKALHPRLDALKACGSGHPPAPRSAAQISPGRFPAPQAGPPQPRIVPIPVLSTRAAWREAQPNTPVPAPMPQGDVDCQISPHSPLVSTALDENGWVTGNEPMWWWRRGLERCWGHC